MYLKDFIYNDIKLSDVGFFVGFANSDNSDSVNGGSKLKLNTIKNYNLYTSEIINVDYEDNIEVTFDIIKNPCVPSFGNTVSGEEMSFVYQWLNTKKYNKFIPIYDDNSFYNTYYYGTFTEINPIIIGGNVIGLSVTLSTNAPYGFREVDKHDFHIQNSQSSINIHNDSDEIEVLYPDKFQVTCLASGDLKIYNLNENNDHVDSKRHTELKNCISGEIITFDCVHKIITSSNVSHIKIYNDFNYDFPRFYNGNNNFMSSISCDIYVDYRPIRKVGVII